MLEKNNLDAEKKVENWVSAYYLRKACLSLTEAMDYSERMLVKFMLIGLGLIVVFLLFLLLEPKGCWDWIAYGIFVAVYLSINYFFKRKRDRYYNEKVLSSEALKKKIEKTTQSFSSFTVAEKEKLLNLITLSQDKAVSKETFQKELREILKLEGLKQWDILQEINMYVGT